MHLNVVRSGEGPAVVLLHGLTATNRYVVMGSKNLERSGHTVIAYDARGHGESDPGDSYGYDALAQDLINVMDDAGIERAVMAGASMGSHTALHMALNSPERVAGLVVATPGYDPEHFADPASLERWDRLSTALRESGVEGFVEAYGAPTSATQWHDTLTKVLRQRMAEHRHPDAVADALHGVPRSQPFGTFADLAAIDCPVAVVGSRDEPDPGHPLETAKAYAEALRTDLIVEEPGKSPIAWQGGQFSKVIAEVVQRSDLHA